MSIVNRIQPAATTFGMDHSLSLLNHGYHFWEVMRQRSDSEIVQTRLLHERVTAVRGSEAAKFFYDEPDTERSSALPTALVGPLFGKGPVHMLDGATHDHRKTMFNDLLGPEAVLAVTNDLARRWDEQAATWDGPVDVFNLVGGMLLESGCAWVGIPMANSEIACRTRDMLSMVDGFGAPTTRQLCARRARRRADGWMGRLVEESRALSIGASTPLDVIAHHHDENGRLIPVHTAAVEVINLIRPLVAVSWLVAGLFEACCAFPAQRAEILAERVSAMHVAQEVRRTYPFVPFLATRAKKDLNWKNTQIPSGTLLVLDVWGTNHDPRAWRDPGLFDPSRFEHTPVTPYNLIPQGGGFRAGGHRCPGEDMTLSVLSTLVTRVARMDYEVIGPRANLRRMPPRPRLMVNVA